MTLDAKKIDAAVSAVERFKSRVDRYADAADYESSEGNRCSDAEEQQESKSRSKETTHNKETRQTKDGEKHVVETKQTSEPQAEDKPDPAAKAQSGESKAAVNALKTKIAQDKKEERYAKRDDAMKPDPNMSAEKMDKMVSTTEKLVKRMDAYEARCRSDDYGHPIASGFRTQEQERRSDDTVTQEEIHHTIAKHQRDERAEDDEESDAKGGDNPRKDAEKRADADKENTPEWEREWARLERLYDQVEDSGDSKKILEVAKQMKAHIRKQQATGGNKVSMFE